MTTAPADKWGQSENPVTQEYGKKSRCKSPLWGVWMREARKTQQRPQGPRVLTGGPSSYNFSIILSVFYVPVTKHTHKELEQHPARKKNVLWCDFQTLFQGTLGSGAIIRDQKESCVFRFCDFCSFPHHPDAYLSYGLPHLKYSSPKRTLLLRKEVWGLVSFSKQHSGPGVSKRFVCEGLGSKYFGFAGYMGSVETIRLS